MANIRLSDYILEQQVSPASCFDVVIEEYAGAINVAAAIVNAEVKQMMMLEYASEYTMEADDSTSTETKKKNIFQKIGGGIKFLWNKFIGWLKHVAEWAKGLFKRKKKGSEDIARPFTGSNVSVDQAITLLKGMTDEEKKSFKTKSKPFIDSVASIVALANSVGTLAEKLDAVEDSTPQTDAEVDKMIKKFEEVVNEARDEVKDIEKVGKKFGAQAYYSITDPYADSWDAQQLIDWFEKAAPQVEQAVDQLVSGVKNLEKSKVVPEMPSVEDELSGSRKKTDDFYAKFSSKAASILSGYTTDVVNTYNNLMKECNAAVSKVIADYRRIKGNVDKYGSKSIETDAKDKEKSAFFAKWGKTAESIKVWNSKHPDDKVSE